MFDKFPYTNFHELNLDYFINKFNEIFTEWEQLNSTMLEWKAATDASNALWKTSVENGLAAWKTATEADLNARETALRAELAAWKTATEADIGTWETDTLAALNAWKTTAEATFEAIRVQAAASATAAQTAQTAAETAQTAAETAQTAAETAAASVSASAAQIATNTGDISNLKEQAADVDVFANGFEYPTPIEITVTAGKYWNSETNVAVLTDYNSYSASNAIPATAGKKYRAIVYTGSSNRQDAVLCVDSEYNILSRYKLAPSENRTYEFIAPANCAYILLTKGTTSTSTTYKCEIVELSYITYEQIKNDIDSKEQYYNLLNGKNVAIIGDSISTNGNDGEYPNAVEITIQTEDVGVQLSAYLTYYDYTNGLTIGNHTFTEDEIGTEVTFTPTANDVGKKIGLPNNYNASSVVTWWENIMAEYPFNPIPVCWSGSSYSSHDTATRFRTSYAWHEAQIRKCGIRTPGTMQRTAPDIIILYRGTNDFSHTPYDIITNNYPGGISWEYPNDDTVTGGKGLKEAICLTVKKLREAYPNAFIFICTLNTFKRINYSTFPVNNGINTIEDYNNAIRECAEWLGIPVIEFAQDGITFENCYTGGYLKESDESTHPTNKGHEVMGYKALAEIKAKYSPTT